MKISMILAVFAFLSSGVSADTFLWKRANNEQMVDCAWQCNDFEDSEVVVFELVPLGVTMTGGGLTAVYTSLKSGGYCVATDGLKIPFFVKAHHGVKIIDAAFIEENEGNCPINGIWLDPDYFGEISDARQIVLFKSNKKHFDWSVGRKYKFVRKGMEKFDVLTDREKEFGELHIN